MPAKSLVPLLFALAVSGAARAQQDGESPHPSLLFAPPAPWVETRSIDLSAPSPTDQVKNGTYFLLSDRQTDARTGVAHFHRYAKRFDSESALSSGASIEIAFDPAYQSTTFHTLALHRDGQVIDQLHPSAFRVVARELGHERQLYDGRLTVIAILEDVRVGDTLDYAYTITGSNPVFSGKFYTSFSTSWSIPLESMHYRLLSDPARPLEIRDHASGIPCQTTEHETHLEYRWTADRLPAVSGESEVPYFYDNWGWVEVSEYGSWADVAQWATRQYDTPSPIPDSLNPHLQSIRDLPSDHEKAAAALRYVQENIRYLGMFDGVHSHRPHDVETIARRRFGDCKDKTLLLVSMLADLGITASPALVDTGYRSAIADLLPSPFAFDHVITRIDIAGTPYWVDPTRSYQRGQLSDIHLPDYGRALVVSPATTSLSQIPPPRTEHNAIEVAETFTFTSYDGPADYHITTVYRGATADSQRAWHAAESPAEIRQNYLDYYRDEWRDLTVSADFSTTDDEHDNRFTITENYRINHAWEPSGSDGDSITARFFARTIDAELSEPSPRVRTAPFALRSPRFVTQTITLKFPTKLDLSDQETTVENDIFKYSCSAKADGNDYVIRHTFLPKTDHVPTAQLPAYLAGLDKVSDHLIDRVWVPAEFASGGPSVAPSAGLMEILAPNWFLIGISLAAFSLSTVCTVALTFWRPRPLTVRTESERQRLTGLGGWLILVGIQVTLLPVISTLLTAFVALGFDSDAWVSLTDSVSADYFPTARVAIATEACYQAAMIPVSLLCAISFYRRRSAFPHLYVSILLLQALTDIALAVFAPDTGTPAGGGEGEAVTAAIRSAGTLALWGSYIYASRRVRFTFTRGKTPQPPPFPTPA